MLGAQSVCQALAQNDPKDAGDQSQGYATALPKCPSGMMRPAIAGSGATIVNALLATVWMFLVGYRLQLLGPSS